MPLLEISELSKSYSGVTALRDVSVNVAAGEVRALCGENGAGKSTLIKCLSGVVTPDSGTVSIAGQALAFGTVSASEAAGIAVIHQESTTFPDLNAVDNIFVGRELKNRFGLLDYARMSRTATELMATLGQQVDLRRPLSELSLASRQMVAMARALLQECKLLIMDEPTASLSARETKLLMATVQRLKQEGVAILYVSHRLEEVFALADRVTVLRDGAHVSTGEISSITEADLIRSMVGRDAVPAPMDSQRVTGDLELEVRNLSGNGFVDISLSLKAGEIVGLAGLVGAGRSELARAIMGLDRYAAGEILVRDRVLPAGSVRASLERGVALVPEDRQHEGLVLPMSVRQNMSLTALTQSRRHRRERGITRFGLCDRHGEDTLVEEFMQRLDVRAASTELAAESLSGGNQQKIVLGKWLATNPRILILDEPTRGVDVGAKAQVHELIRQLAEAGMATLLISSELPELLSTCNRILVMSEGRIAGELESTEATEEAILQLAMPDTAGRLP